jgi:hypothetical protein
MNARKREAIAEKTKTTQKRGNGYMKRRRKHLRASILKGH